MNVGVEKIGKLGYFESFGGLEDAIKLFFLFVFQIVLQLFHNLKDRLFFP